MRRAGRPRAPTRTHLIAIAERCIVTEQQARNVDVAAQKREFEGRLARGGLPTARLRARLKQPPALVLVPYRRSPCQIQREWIHWRAGAG